MSAALTARQVQALRAVAAGDTPNRTISIPNAVAAALAVIAEQEAELVEQRAIKQRLEAMASPDWAGSLRFPLVHGVDIVRLARMALTGEDPS